MHTGPEYMVDGKNNEKQSQNSLRMTAEIVSAYVGHNEILAQDVSKLINAVHTALNGVGVGAPGSGSNQAKPPVSIRQSVTQDYLICLEDGKKMTMLKRYLKTHYGMTPDEYRKKWGLPADYPMVAPSYAAMRSAFAKKIGLGRGTRNI